MKRLASLGLCLVLSTAALAGDLPPPPTDRVHDAVAVLDPSQRAEVVAAIDALERDLGAELGVCVLDSSHGEASADYARRIFNHWGVGKAGADNGVLLTLLVSDRRVEVTPGDGYRNLFTRARCQTLLERYVVPELKRGQHGQAVVSAVHELCDAVRMHEQGLSPSNLEAAPRPAAPVHTTSRQAIPSHAVPSHGVPSSYAPYSAPPTHDGSGVVVIAAILGIPVILGLAWLLRPRCPRCKETLRVRKRTVQAATYSRSGRGEKTSTCRCGYRRVTTYTIPQRTHTTTTSFGSSGGFGSSGFGSGGGFSSGGGGSSFGGGSSSGGGGGASW